MPNSDKNIAITPNRGLSGTPEITLTGAGVSSISMRIPDDTTATLNFQTTSSSKTIFTIDANFLGTLCSVSDFNQIPVIEISDNRITLGAERGVVTVLGNGLKLPSYSTSNLPPGEEGLVVYDSTTKTPKIHNGTSWIPLGFQNSGLTPETAGLSAAQIKSDYPYSVDGYYWIRTNIGPVQIYCIMRSEVHGGGWMGLNEIIAPISIYANTTPKWTNNISATLEAENRSVIDLSMTGTGTCNRGVTYYTLQSPSVVGINYTNVMFLMHRVTTIGQCTAITNLGGTGTDAGWYPGSRYTGVYNSYSTCTWDSPSGPWSQPCCATGMTTTQKPFWVLRATGTNMPINWDQACGSDSGQHIHMWFVK